MTHAVIAVDIQNDFLEGGALGVAGSFAIVDPMVNAANSADLVIATGDGHPADHMSFSDEPKFVDKSWPSHCVEGTKGAEIHPDVLAVADIVVRKGHKQELEQYSPFDDVVVIVKHPDNSRIGEEIVFAELLRENEVTNVTVGGLATDYCVRGTALGAVENGFTTTLLQDASMGVAEATSEAALNEMAEAGVTLA